MTNKPTTSNNENDLFRDAVADVTPLKHNKTIYNTPKPPVILLKTTEDPKPAPIDMLSDEYEPIDSLFDDLLSYCHPGVQRRIFRKLRRGHYHICDELDLHGFNVQQAKTALLQFIHDASPIENSCVRLIHGKGSRNSKGSILKRKVDHWLQQHERVLAYHSTQPKDGGSGAVYILLRRQY